MKNTSYVKRTREAKKNAQINAIALRMGKDQKNPNAIKSEKFKRKWKEFKEKTISIYKSKATAQYYKNQSGSNNSGSNIKKDKQGPKEKSYTAKDTTN